MPSPQRGELVTQLEPVVAAAVRDIGFELEEVDVQPAGRRRIVKVIVDSENGIGLDDIANVSRHLSPVLDEHDHVLAGPYTLEVTSPGVDRPLTKPRHWRRAHLHRVRIRFADGAERSARVGDADADGVRLLIDGSVSKARYREIEHACVEVEFQQPPAAELSALAGTSGGAERGSNDGARKGNGTEESR